MLNHQVLIEHIVMLNHIDDWFVLIWILMLEEKKYKFTKVRDNRYVLRLENVTWLDVSLC
jgi:hypothetical protein